MEDRPQAQMLAEQRRNQILLELQRTGEARTRQLAAGFGVSEVTIRSDLALLESRNRLIKTHGGAIPVATDSTSATFEQRMQRNFDAKRRIAQMAAGLIISNQSIVFDSGSTLLQLAMQMPPVDNVVVATNAMNIAQYLMYRPGLDVHMIGGRVYPSTASTIVADLDGAVGGLLAHQAFVGAHAIDHAFDVVDLSEDVARTKRNLVRMARRVIVLADSSKWEIGATSKAFSLSRVDLIITDDGLPAVIRSRAEKLGVEIRYA